MALTLKQKEDNKKRVALRIIHNGIKMDFSMHKIETWNHLHLKLGLPPVTTDSPITFPELKSFLDNQTKELESKLNGEVISNIRQPTIVEVTHAKEVLSEPKDLPISQSIPTPLSQPIQQSPAPTKSVEVVMEHSIADNYGYIRSPNVSPNYFPFWFQKKASAEIKQKIFIEKKRGILLLAATGLGETFIAFDVIRDAFDRQWADGKTWSHIPYLYVTKSTILEQTGRVCKKLFNIKPNV